MFFLHKLHSYSDYLTEGINCQTTSMPGLITYAYFWIFEGQCVHVCLHSQRAQHQYNIEIIRYIAWLLFSLFA
jgi:hypothetical protein